MLLLHRQAGPSSAVFVFHPSFPPASHRIQCFPLFASYSNLPVKSLASNPGSGLTGDATRATAPSPPPPPSSLPSLPSSTCPSRPSLPPSTPLLHAIPRAPTP